MHCILLAIILGCAWQSNAQNSSEPSLQSVLNGLIQKVNDRKVTGNASDSIAISELPGYTGWNRNRIDSKVDKCFVTQIGGQKFSQLRESVQHFQYDMSKSANNTWSVSIACPNVTIPVEQGHIPAPCFYARAYGPAILVGNQNLASLKSIVQKGQHYTVTDISFAIRDPGLYTIEIVLESIFTPNIYSLPHTTEPVYDGFLLRGFPLILNVTNSAVGCNTAKSCNLTFCRGKDIESDLTSSSGRWIVLGHTTTSIDLKTNVQFQPIPKKNESDFLYQRYSQGSNRLGIEIDYKPLSCALVPLKSSFKVLDACVDTGIHFILIGDSTMVQHAFPLKKYLNARNRITLVALRGKYCYHSLFISHGIKQVNTIL
jgi:hypothetical protein